MSYQLLHGDCLDVIGSLPDASFDAIITDPPYPCIRREYGTWTEGEWLGKMKRLVPELRRVLKPSGSCVMVLQPNSERVGRMRTWLWHFMAWVGDEWGIVQDAYWLNTTALATGEGVRRGLPKAAIKPCVWMGGPECYRDRAKVMWRPSQHTVMEKLESRALQYRPSGPQIRGSSFKASLEANGGSIPLNVIPVANADSTNSAGAAGHGAGTPLELCRWWTRYICPPGGAILDPFCGSGTVGLAALDHGCSFVGIEKFDRYIPMAEARLAEAASKNATPQMRLAV